MSQIKSIVKEPMGDKDWVKVTFENGTIWIPALEDLAVIAQKIGLCEDERYGFPQNNVKGADMVWEYIRDVIRLGTDSATLKTLKEQYKFPNTGPKCGHERL